MNETIDDGKRRARDLLRQFKGDAYAFGLGCADRLGAWVAQVGRRALVVASGVGKGWAADIHASARRSLSAAGVEVVGDFVRGARPNTPREDVARIAEAIGRSGADVVVAIGGGSVIDGVKASAAVAALGADADLDACFGAGQVTERLAGGGRAILPIVAMQLASGSAAHLTRYSNVTDLAAGQKKLIVDDAVVPARAVFDYAHTATMSPAFTADGGMDGVAHCLEVFYGLAGDALGRVRPVAALGIELIVGAIRDACRDGDDLAAREAIGLGTDLGGYAIMLGGTNGAHLTSFSLVDILPHGRACALMNPYYTVLFAPAVEDQLRAVAAIFHRAGLMADPADRLGGRDLGLAVAEAMVELARQIGMPTTLAEVEGFNDAHIARALAAAKNPQLEMKLRNMPVPLSAETVDDIMGPVLEAARTGDFSVIRTMP